MANMLDYMRAEGSFGFGDKPFNEVDNLIYSQLSYLEYGKCAHLLPEKLSRLGGLMGYGVMERHNSELFMLASTKPRFVNSSAFHFVSEFSKADTRQFAAVTFLLPDDGSAFVSFRGTDSTLVGWKEDFMLSFTTPVPAQTRAVEYLNEIGTMLRCPLRVGGHSKGGNLAVYASAFCEKSVQDRITDVYSNDGPGFDGEVLQSEGYRAIRARVKRLIPESSAVGILMDSDSSRRIVKSGSIGIFQHDPYSWLIAGDDFITCPETSFSSDMISRSQRDWFKALPPEKREEYTDLVFNVLTSGNAQTLKDLRSDPTILMATLRALKNLPEEDKDALTGFVRQLFSSLYAGGSEAVKVRYERFADLVKQKLGLNESSEES